MAKYHVTNLFLTKGLVTRKISIYVYIYIYIYIYDVIQTMMGKAVTRRKRRALALLLGEGGFRLADIRPVTNDRS